MAAGEIDEDALAFFNSLDGALEIELSEQAKPFAPYVINRAAPASAQIVQISLSIGVGPSDEDEEEEVEERDLTQAEWERVVLRMPLIRFRGYCDGEIFEYRAPDGVSFTIRDLVNLILETERKTRAKTEWLGGVDMHHIYFSGIERQDDGVWEAHWDS